MELISLQQDLVHQKKQNLIDSTDQLTIEDAPIFHLLFLLKSKGGSMDASSLLNKQDESLKVFYESLLKMKSNGWIEYFPNGQVTLTASGKALVPKKAKDRRFTRGCGNCGSRGYTCSKDFPALALFREIATNRPIAKAEFDQWYMLPEHALHRAGFMNSRGDLLNKRILIIGDDDLLGLALALTNLPSEVVVLDFDERIINFTNEVAKSHNLRISAEFYDARLGFPEKLKGRFDVFACDPVETVEGVRVFVSRGSTSLKGPGSVVYFGLTTLECGKKKWMNIQREVIGMGMAITDVIRNFTEYPDPGWEAQLPIWKNLGCKPTETWYKSAFCRLEAIDEIRPAVVGDYEGDFFYDEETWATTAEKV